MTSTVRCLGGDPERVEGVVSVQLGNLPLGGAPGVLWGLDSSQLNANLVALGAGECIEGHTNDEVDQLLVVQVGAGVVVIDGVEHRIGTDSLLLIPRGAHRSIRATKQMAYLSIHIRRSGLQPRSR